MHFNNVKIEPVAGEEGKTLVSVPIKPRSVGNGVVKASMNFEVKTEKVNTLKESLMEIVPKMKERWNDFLFKRKVKQSNIDEKELLEFFDYETAKIFWQNKQNAADLAFEEVA